MKILSTLGVCAVLLFSNSAVASSIKHNHFIELDEYSYTSTSDAALDRYGAGDVNISNGSRDYSADIINHTHIPNGTIIGDADQLLTSANNKKDHWAKWEVGVTLAEEGIFSWDEVDSHSYTEKVDTAETTDDSLKVGADIEITYAGNEAQEPPAPEPATMALFGIGLGLTGLTALRRKISIG